MIKWWRRFKELPTKWPERSHAQLTQGTNERMNRRIIESMNAWTLNHWMNGPMNLNQWTTMNQWTNESMKQSIDQWVRESMNQWVNESMNQWIKESTVIEPMKQWWWFSESKNQWVSQWILEPMNQWISDSMHIDFMSQSTNESMNGWISEAMNEGTNEWHLLATPLSYSYFFSERPLIWAASALNCLPATSSAASATQFFPLRSQHGRFCNLQLQFKKKM
jgi:hypothetical protein